MSFIVIIYLVYIFHSLKKLCALLPIRIHNTIKVLIISLQLNISVIMTNVQSEFTKHLQSINNQSVALTRNIARVFAIYLQILAILL